MPNVNCLFLEVMAILLSRDSLTPEIKKLIMQKTSIKPNVTQYNPNPKPIKCFANREEGVYIPLGMWKEFLDEFPNYGQEVWIPMKKNARCTKAMYTIESDPKGYRDQDVVVNEAYERLLIDHVCFIAASPGFGKTSMGNYLACKFKTKCVVTCHIHKVNIQWVDEFRDFSTCKVQHIKDKNILDPDADVYVIGLQKLSDMDPSVFANAGIGFLIYDEAHVATITAFSKALLNICPQYVLGLSATPERADGMQKLLTSYFGPKKDFIYRQETKNFTVYKYETDYVPDIQYKVYNNNATLDWTNLLNSLAYNEERQNMIADIVLSHPEDRILILSDRVAECDSLYFILSQSLDENSVYLMDDKNKKDKIETIQNYRILIAGRKRAGIGFNDPTRTLLVLCTDCKDVRQNEGRIRTSDNIIYDVVDNYSTLEKHWAIRRKWYESKGATIVEIPRKKKDGKKIMTEMPSRRLLKANK